VGEDDDLVLCVGVGSAIHFPRRVLAIVFGGNLSPANSLGQESINGNRDDTTNLEEHIFRARPCQRLGHV